MKSFSYCLLTLFLCSAQLVTAQINNPESIKLASELSKQFPEAIVYQEENTSTLAFSVTDGKIKGAILNMVEDHVSDYLSLKDNVSIGVYEGYGAFSSVDKIQSSTKDGKKYVVNYSIAVDKAVESGGIFHSDARYKVIELNFASKGVREKSEVTKIFKDYKFLEALYFHTSYPQKKRIISFKLPTNVDVFKWDCFYFVCFSIFNHYRSALNAICIFTKGCIAFRAI
jgi:hypothetical protein